jgi:hypothetical protein
MPKLCMMFASLLCLALPSAALSQLIPSEAGIRYSEQISNAPPGGCGCFAMQGAAVDGYWKTRTFMPGKSPLSFGLAADVAVENTSSVNGAPWGLTLSTFTAGPRLKMRVKKFGVFGELLLGVAHGSNSEFPQKSANTLVSSATSLAYGLGTGVDYPIDKLVSVRMLQLDVLRTDLPNNVNDWQNNLRVGAGLTLHFPHL